MGDQYKIDKWVWTEADIDQMSWHDVHVYAVAFLPDTFELMLDIDYILEWIQPAPNETYFKFWVVPATLVFENVYDINLELDEPDFELETIDREEPQRPRNYEYLHRDTEWLWHLESHRGGLSFRSVGFKQFIRRQPVLSQRQTLGVESRGGISFFCGRVDA